IYLAGALVLLAAFVDAISVILLFFLMAVIFAIGLSPAVNWLEARRWPRVVATIALLVGIGAVIAGVVALVVPQVSREMSTLQANVRGYGVALSQRIDEAVGRYPEVDAFLHDPKLGEKLMPSISTVMARIGRYSLTAIAVA